MHQARAADALSAEPLIRLREVMKSNVITGIDRPTSGEVNVAGTRVGALSQRQLALWRGRNVGVVFQFFQLLPALTIAENVVLPMEFCGTYGVALAFIVVTYLLWWPSLLQALQGMHGPFGRGPGMHGSR